MTLPGIPSFQHVMTGGCIVSQWAAGGSGGSGVVFLDRDGVINRDSPDYIKRLEEFEFLPRSLKALQTLHAAGYRVFVITNQSAVARGLMPAAELERIHREMIGMVRQHGGWISDVFYCPHHPDDRCDCRKPKTGLIRQAQAKYPIDIATATMVGDNVKDMECAMNAGCRHRIMVRTGNGAFAAAEIQRRGLPVDAVVPDLAAAAEWIVARHRFPGRLSTAP
jgi:D-glycero-D-manno-heptose 1,7-bisphosphate phosphatase